MKSGNEVCPTATCTPARVMLYQPSQRPKQRVGDWVETSFGRCQVKGRLGQRHADVLESILYCAERRRDSDDGGVEVLVDPARVRKTLSDSRFSHAQLETLLSELRSAVLTIQTRQFDTPIIGGLIDHAIPSPMTRYDPLTGGKRNLLRVRLGAALVMLLEHDLKLFYNPALLARLNHGISQAVARHILSHRTEPNGGWLLDTVIRAVSGDIKGEQIRKNRTRIREDAERLGNLGVIVDGDRLKKRATPAR